MTPRVSRGGGSSSASPPCCCTQCQPPARRRAVHSGQEFMSVIRWGQNPYKSGVPLLFDFVLLKGGELRFAPVDTSNPVVQTAGARACCAVLHCADALLCCAVKKAPGRRGGGCAHDCHCSTHTVRPECAN